MPAKTTGHHIVQSGRIAADEVYTLTEFQKRTGLAKKALAQCRRRGLDVHKASGRVFIFGRSWMNYLERQATAGGDV